MTLTPSSGGPIGCPEWDALVDEDGFLALGRNRHLCSYLVYTDGTYFYAENGTTGELDFGGPNNQGTPPVSGTDAHAVIQAAINTFPSYGATVNQGGWLHIKAGDYVLTDRLDVSEKVGLTISGESSGCYESGRGTWLVLGNNVDTAVIYGSGTLPNAYYLTLRNLTIGGNKANQTALVDGIYLENMLCIKISDVGVRDAKRDGIHLPSDEIISIEDGYSLSNDRHGVYIGSNHVRIEGIYASTNGSNGIYVANNSNIRLLANSCDLNTNSGIVLEGTEDASLLGCACYDNVWHGLHILSGAEADVEGGIYKDNSTGGAGWSGILIEDSSRCRVLGTRCWDTKVGGAKLQAYGIRTFGTSDNNMIAFNDVTGNLTAEILLVGTSNSIYGNEGYPTENWGVATMLTGTAAIAVAHGLAGTPTVFSLAGQHAEVSALYVTAAGAANFTINKGTAGNTTGNRDIYWEAKVR